MSESATNKIFKDRKDRKLNLTIWIQRNDILGREDLDTEGVMSEVDSDFQDSELWDSDAELIR